MAQEHLRTTLQGCDRSPVQAKARFFRQSRNFADPGACPDGGWVAWRQVLGGFIVTFLSWGFINSFGLFQTFYDSQQWVSASPSAISWIGSLQMFLLMFVGAYSGSASDAGYFRLTSFAGIFFFVFGVFMTSVCHEFWQLVLAHGVCTGLGNGLCFIPTMSVVSTYFSPNRKSLAVGSMLCGAAVGGIILPILFNNLLDRIGFGWTMRVFGFLALTLFSCAQMLLKKRLPPKDGVRILDFDALKDRVFVLFVIGSFVNFLGLYLAFFYINSFARNVLGLSFSKANNLLLVANGAGIPGRLIPMWLADQRQWRGVRPVTVQIPVNLITGVLFFAWIAVDSTKGAYAFIACYGFFANGLQSLFPASLADMTLDPRKSGAQLGWGFTIGSFSVLIGNPIGGLLIEAKDGDYLYAQIYAGLSALLGCSIVVVVAILRARQQRAIQTSG